MKTHGEEWYKWKCHLNSMNSKFSDAFERPPKAKNRMSRADASKYYRAKCRRVFKDLGMIEEKTEFERKFPAVRDKVQLATKKMIFREARKNNRILQEMVA